MKYRWLIYAALLLILLPAGACRRDEAAEEALTDTTDTSTGISATDTSTTSTASGVSTLSPADKDFVMKAAQAGLAEVSMGQTASQKGQNADVKSFGSRMVTDHGTANDELKQLATGKGIDLPTEPAEEHKKAAEHLGSLTGAEFDKAYMMHMVEDHRKDVQEFQNASTSLLDADLKAWATKTLPTLQEHLRMAEQTQAKLK